MLSVPDLKGLRMPLEVNPETSKVRHVSFCSSLSMHVSLPSLDVSRTLFGNSFEEPLDFRSMHVLVEI